MEEMDGFKELEFPDSTDTLFIEGNKDNGYYNAMVRSGISQFFYFSEGYKNAAVQIYENFDGSGYQANTLVYPLVFLNRQYIELVLKEIIIGLNMLHHGKMDFEGTHNIERLFTTFQTLYVALGENFKVDDVLMAVKRLMDEFHRMDGSSMAFRYPVDKTAERNPTLLISILDLQNFQTTMVKLYNFFDCVNMQIYAMVDQKNEYLNELRTMYESDI